MNFRAATNEDREAIEALIFPILRSYALEPSPGTTDADLQDIEAHYSENRGRFEVLVDEMDKILGTVAIQQTSPNLCELRKMYLAESLRGQGWGGKLLDRALDIARELDYEEVWLETAHVLSAAHDLYRRNGFEPYKGPHCSDRCDFAMAKKLR